MVNWARVDRGWWSCCGFSVERGVWPDLASVVDEAEAPFENVIPRLWAVGTVVRNEKSGPAALAAVWAVGFVVVVVDDVITSLF